MGTNFRYETFKAFCGYYYTYRLFSLQYICYNKYKGYEGYAIKIDR